MTGYSSSENDRARPNLQPATPIGCGKLASWPAYANSPMRQVGLRQVGKLRHIRKLQPHIEVQLAEQFSTCRTAGKLDAAARPKKGGKLTAYDASNQTAATLILANPEAQGGLESLACRWARLFLSRHQPGRLHGELFVLEGLPW